MYLKQLFSLRRSLLQALGILLANLLVLSPSVHAAPWHEESPGSGVAAHYVRFAGPSMLNDSNRKYLAELHQACVEMKRSTGAPSEPLPAGGLPAVVSYAEREFYYASNRTLSVSKTKSHAIDMGNCALTSSNSTVMHLRSAIGHCSITMGSKEARGECDSAAHERAPVSTRTARPVLAWNMSKVPPNMRATVQQQMELLQQSADSQSTVAPGGGRKTRVIAGNSCTMHGDVSLREFCIANPKPTPTNPITPYPIPATGANSHVPGLLIYSKFQGFEETAEQVVWNLSVSPDLFKVPAGFKVQQLPRTRP